MEGGESERECVRIREGWKDQCMCRPKGCQRGRECMQRGGMEGVGEGVTSK